MNQAIGVVERIRSQYTERKKTKLEELVELNKKAKRPAKIFAYVFGTVGALVLGTGMCFAMKVIGNAMPLGIAVGLAGMVMVTVNYTLYKAIERKGKAKYAKKILVLSDEILNQ